MDYETTELSLLARYAKWRLQIGKPSYHKFIIAFFVVISVYWFFIGDWKLGTLMLAVAFMSFIELGYAELFEATNQDKQKVETA